MKASEIGRFFICKKAGDNMPNFIENPADYVFLVWGNAVKKKVGKGNYSMGSSATPVKAPYARILMLGNATKDRNLEADEETVTLAFQCESYADGQLAINDVYEIDRASHEAMIGLGFRRSMGAELIDSADSSVKRVVSRYRMTYAGKFIGQL